MLNLLPPQGGGREGQSCCHTKQARRSFIFNYQRIWTNYLPQSLYVSECVYQHIDAVLDPFKTKWDGCTTWLGAQKAINQLNFFWTLVVWYLVWGVSCCLSVKFEYFILSKGIIAIWLNDVCWFIYFFFLTSLLKWIE